MTLRSASASARRRPRARPVRVLIAGFGPFPGVPDNPAAGVARRFAARAARRPGGELQVSAAVVPTTWELLDDLPGLLARLRPDIIIALGVAVEAPVVRIETIALNRATRIAVDAVGARARSRRLRADGPPALHAPADPGRLVRMARSLGLPLRISRDAGDYLCNGLFYEATRLVRASGRTTRLAFVHVPRPHMARGARPADFDAVVALTITALKAGL
ncbi:peptidase C15 [Segnochrobactraceae bacterium EtOH-i3]